MRWFRLVGGERGPWLRLGDVCYARLGCGFQPVEETPDRLMRAWEDGGCPAAVYGLCFAAGFFGDFVCCDV